MTATDRELPAFRAPYAAPDDELAALLLADTARPPAAEQRIDARARRLIEARRSAAWPIIRCSPARP
jgi:hypothetical protein